MALPASEVKKAVAIFRDLLGVKGKVPFLEDIDQDSGIQPEHHNKVLYFGKVQDGWESIIIVVTKFDSSKFKEWERRRGEVKNSSFISLEKGILTLGFF